MSRKYIRQQILQDFVYPNNDVAQYDVEIVQNINNNCVDGDINSFTATTVNSTGITFSLNASYILNGAEPFNLQSGQRSVLSVHMMGSGQNYFKPWRLVKNYTGSTASTGTTIVDTFTVLPSQLGLASFSSGVYYFEFRFIGHKCVLPVCYTLNLSPPVPTATPTNTPTPTVTPTPTATPFGPTPTPTPTVAPVGQCYCFPVVVTGSTLPPPEGGVIATLDYNDCFGVRTSRAFTTGPGTYYQCIQVISSVVQYFEGTEGIDETYLNLTYLTGNCNTGYDCSGYVPSGSTPTPTATSTPTPTPTPTPTATPTPTPTPTEGGVTSFGGCGYGGSVSAACNDAGINNRTLYSDCNSGTFGVGCFVYVDTFPNALTGYTNVFMNSGCWDINSSTGQVTAFSSVQC